MESLRALSAAGKGEEAVRRAIDQHLTQAADSDGDTALFAICIGAPTVEPCAKILAAGGSPNRPSSPIAWPSYTVATDEQRL